MKPFVFGDALRFTTAQGQTFDAEVILASSNGRSLALGFHGIASTGSGGWLTKMPVLLDEDGQWHDLTGMPVHIKRASTTEDVK